MKNFFLFSILLVVTAACFSQETQKDSLATNDFLKLERKLFYNELFNFADNSLYGGLIDFKSAFYKQPLFPESNWKTDFNSMENPFPISNQSVRIGYDPMFSQFSIMNQARYQINDKFSIGGNSFSGSSIFNPMPINRPFSEMEIKGASMFMEYKVSKKFKIETRVSVSNRNSMFPAP